MKKKLLATLLVSVVLALGLALVGCGSKTSGKEGSEYISGTWNLTTYVDENGSRSSMSGGTVNVNPDGTGTFQLDEESWNLTWEFSTDWEDGTYSYDVTVIGDESYFAIVDTTDHTLGLSPWEGEWWMYFDAAGSSSSDPNASGGILPGASNNSDNSSEQGDISNDSNAIVGTWNITSYTDDNGNTSNATDGLFTARTDGTGTVEFNGTTYDLIWEFSTDWEDGTYSYDVNVIGDTSYFCIVDVANATLELSPWEGDSWIAFNRA